MGVVVSGIGTCYSEQVLTNKDLEKTVDTSDEWIKKRTGIEQRRVYPLDKPVKASDLGVQASLKAIEQAKISVDEIDGIINSSIYPDAAFPATACFIQDKLGVKKGFAFDITAACAGFVYSINLAHLMIENGQANHVLVVGSELLSRVVNWQDRNSCILFGDAGGAVVLSKHNSNRGFIGSILKSSGQHHAILKLSNMCNNSNYIEMDGQNVFKLAVSSLSDILEETLNKYNYKVQDLHFIAFHQANIRIINAVAEKLNIQQEQVLVNVNRYGNTSSASIPLVLKEAQDKSRLQENKLVAFVGIGGGMSWGCNLMYW